MRSGLARVEWMLWSEPRSRKFLGAGAPVKLVAGPPASAGSVPNWRDRIGLNSVGVFHLSSFNLC